MARSKKETTPPDLIPGIPIPDDLQERWRQVRAMKIAVQSAMDALLGRSAVNASYEASLWDETIKRLGLPDGAQISVNYVTMRVLLIGEPHPEMTITKS